MIIFIVPVYNEADNIVQLLIKTNETMLEKGLPYRFILVNDGSSDDSLKIAESFLDKMPLTIVSYFPGKGPGEAFRLGFLKSLEICDNDDIIITKEADNTSDLSIFDKLILKISEGYDLVLASCYAEEGRVKHTTPLRVLLSKSANLIIKLFIPIKGVNTYSSFYRAYSARALKEMHNEYKDKIITESGFECMVELLIKFSRNNKFKITEVPMVLDGSQRAGRSKMKVFRTTMGFLKVIFKEGLMYKLERIFKKGA